MSEKYWVGDAPKVCDLKASHKISTSFVDGKMLGGPWAIMCVDCYSLYGAGLGQGKGQRYTRQEDGRYMKTAG